MKLIIGCEFSGIVRSAFRERGHDAWSCDFLPAEDGSPFHIQGDVRDHLDEGWELGIFHPPCQDLAVSGARWMASKGPERIDAALQLVRDVMAAPIPRIAVENPVSIISSRIRKPDQIVQPWWFGTGEVKATCLWLKGLPKLTPTNIVDGRHPRVHLASPGPDRWKERSRTDRNLAEAMADQWGSALDLGLAV